MGFFYTILYQPVYNLFLFCIHLFNGLSLPLAVVMLVVLVRFFLYPFAKGAWITQKKLEAITPEIKNIQKTYKDKKKQSEKLLSVYKENRVNPFSIIFSLILQISILLTLFFVLQNYSTQTFEEYFSAEHLYSFSSPIEQQPNDILFNRSIKEGTIIFLGLLAAISQFLVIRETQKARKKNAEMSEFMKSLNFQMLYVLPLVILGSSFFLAATVMLYWLTNNLFSLLQEKYLQRYYL